ncbi:MAG TPA: UbiA family prenyltransferase, partial [Kofleriaceae bacterium]|nr:UbiA family prenyltransferase [Kofleriaceae bacterium]
AFQLQAPDLHGVVLLALSIAPLALLQFAMLLAIEFPDAAGDAATGKRTLVVQLGTPRAAQLYMLTTLGAFALAPAEYFYGHLPALTALAIGLPLPLAVWRAARLYDHRDHENPAAYERLTFWAVALLVATSACVLASWLMSSSTLASS